MPQLWLFAGGIVQLHSIPFLSTIFLRKNNSIVEREPDQTFDLTISSYKPKEEFAE